MTLQITGALLIGADEFSSSDAFHGYDPTRGEAFDPTFAEASDADVSRACKVADEVFDSFRSLPHESRARFLEVIAEHIVALGDTLIDRAHSETGLTKGRLESERTRTVNQLKMFATLVRSAEWIGRKSDPAEPERKPFPKPELAIRHIPLGPVAVFGASNFPLAFSVAGGDTASALAAGCPVIVKGHPAHPGTSELVGRAIRLAAVASNVPAGAFALLQGKGTNVGRSLVANPLIQAVGFTGSRTGGLALRAVAAARLQPIPVYAEMSSVNPVILLPSALKSMGESLATEFVASLTLGAGQFCTNPGLVLAVTSKELDEFEVSAANALKSVIAAPMLSESIYKKFGEGVRVFGAIDGVEVFARGAIGGATSECAALFRTSAETFQQNPGLSAEIFGASSLIVHCESTERIRELVSTLEGQLTMTVHLAEEDEEDMDVAKALLPLLERKAGRVLVNGWPTGVEVSPAMVHGGPFPATTDSRTTSVGTLAIQRFLRPVCYQAFPRELLPCDFH